MRLRGELFGDGSGRSDLAIDPDSAVQVAKRFLGIDAFLQRSAPDWAVAEAATNMAAAIEVAKYLAVMSLSY